MNLTEALVRCEAIRAHARANFGVDIGPLAQRIAIHTRFNILEATEHLYARLSAREDWSAIERDEIARFSAQ